MFLSRRTMMGSTLAAFTLPSTLRALGETALPSFARRPDTPAADPAYLSNGLVGIRPGPNPLLPAPACVAGFVFLHPEHRVESLSPAPYPLASDIRIGPVSLLESPERCSLTTQRLDMANAELTTDLTFDAGNGLTFSLRVRQAALRTEPSLLWQRIELQSSAASSLAIVPEISTSTIPGQPLSAEIPTGGKADRVLLFESLGKLSRLGVAVQMSVPSSFTFDPRSASYSGTVRPGQTYTFDTLASMVSSFYHPEPDIEAIRLVNWGMQSGIERLVADNRSAWADIWRSRILVTDGDDQRGLDAAFFYLHASNHRSNLNGMPPFGLSSSRYYLGHSFWDTETWCFLPLLLTSPEIAESLLRFRRRGLDAAEKVAALFGYRGAQFPWEAAPTNGEEVTPVFAATGWAEQHIVPDVALAFWQYQLAVNDKTFLTDATWPVLRAVAQWIESRGARTARGFEILNIMGPDEASNGLDNSAYVNLACRMVLRAAVQCAALMSIQPPAAWQQIADSIYLPVNAQGVLTVAEHSANDAFGDVSFLWPFDVGLDRGTLERIWEAHRQVRSAGEGIAFAQSAEAALTAVMGDRGGAARLFREAWQRDWLEPFGMTREAAPQTHGCFLTNCGSLLRTAMFGFTGLEIGDGDWNRNEAALPDTWKSIEIARVYVRGEPMHLRAEHGRRAQLSSAE